MDRGYVLVCYWESEIPYLPKVCCQFPLRNYLIYRNGGLYKNWVICNCFWKFDQISLIDLYNASMEWVPLYYSHCTNVNLFWIWLWIRYHPYLMSAYFCTFVIFFETGVTYNPTAVRGCRYVWAHTACIGISMTKDQALVLTIISYSKR